MLLRSKVDYNTEPSLFISIAISMLNPASSSSALLLLSCYCVLGVELGGGCGAVSIRFRPTLTFLPRHADILLEIMDKVASEMK